MKTAARVLMLTVLMNSFDAEAVRDPGANIAENPHFDSDLSGWTGSSDSFTAWTNTQDHHGSGSAGIGSALIQSSGAPEFIAQCMPVTAGGFRYHLVAWAKSTCGSSAQLSLFWANDDCSAEGMPISASTSLPNTWQPLVVDGVVPAGLHGPTAVVVLQNPGSCRDQSYFDDVLFFQDTVFQNGFESGR